jgi:hypothetical protein
VTKKACNSLIFAAFDIVDPALCFGGLGPVILVAAIESKAFGVHEQATNEVDS